MVVDHGRVVPGGAGRSVGTGVWLVMLLMVQGSCNALLHMCRVERHGHLIGTCLCCVGLHLSLF
jgi:hypothetical protein